MTTAPPSVILGDEDGIEGARVNCLFIIALTPQKKQITE